MISLFGNSPLNVPATLAPSPAPPAARNIAVRKATVPTPAPQPRGLFKWLTVGRAKKRLQMVESVSLGEKRFVALVQVDGREFLIGGAPSNVGMLAELAPDESFHQVLKEATQGLNVPVAIPEPVEQLPPAVVQPSAPLPAPYVEPVLATAAANPRTTTSAVPEPQAASHPAVPAEIVPDPAPTRVDPVDAIEPVDLALEEPVSLSPSLLAAMHARKAAAIAPLALAAVEERAVAIPQTVKVQAAVEERVEALQPESIEPARLSKPVSTPQFTFQVSHLLNLGMKAAAWNLQGATS